MQSAQLEKNWSLLVEGDRQGLYECFNLFYDDLYRFGLSLYKDQDLIKDSIQNLFLELWEIREKLSEVKNIKQYVFTIYKRIIYKTNKALDHKNVCLEVLLEDIDHDFLVQNSYESILVANQADEQKQKQLQHALNELSPRQIQIIRLRFYEKKSYQEIAQETGLTERTIYNTLHNAISTLRKSACFLIKTGFNFFIITTLF
jgi:RNA polymerase sigma factor (sigma-70 family)